MCEDSDRVDPLAVLPCEVALHICSFLSARDMVVLGRVSSGWRKLSRDLLLWTKNDIADFTLSETPPDVLYSAPFVNVLTVDAVGVCRRQICALMQNPHAKVRFLWCVCPRDEWDTDAFEIFFIRLMKKYSRWIYHICVTKMSLRMMRVLSRSRTPCLWSLYMKCCFDMPPFGLFDDEAPVNGTQDEIVEAFTDRLGHIIHQHTVVWKDRGPAKSFLRRLHVGEMTVFAYAATMRLLEAQRYTLESFGVSEMDSLNDVEDLMNTLARCTALTRVATTCNLWLGQLEGLPALRKLVVRIKDHDYHADSADDHIDANGHFACLQGLPSKVEDLVVAVGRDQDLEPAVATLVRHARSLRSLKELAVVMKRPDRVQESLRVLSGAVPGVRVRCLDWQLKEEVSSLFET